MQHHDHLAMRTFLIVSLGFSLGACLDQGDDEVLRDGFVEAEPEPEPQPQPHPISADKLVGLHIDDFYAMNTFVDSYQMAPYPSQTYVFNAAADPWYSWPLHAMEWKNHRTGNTLSFSLAAADAAVSASLTGLGDSVHASDPVELNAMETGGLVFSSNPAGDWMEVNYTDPAQGLVYAALVMHFWNTPVYSAAEHFDHQQTGSVMSHTIALQELEFTLVSASDLFAACGLSKLTATPSTALSTIPTCNHGAVLSADEVSLWNSIWGSPSSWTPYEANVNLTPAELTTAYNNSYLGNQGQLVFDPPADVDEEDLAGLADLASALADQVLVEGEGGYLIRLRDYVGE